MPSVAEGREVHDVDWKSELQRALRPYGIDFVDLPDEVKRVLENRQRFTIVEGENPIDFYRGRIDAQNLIQKVLRHDQSTLAVQQMKIYAIHNGITQNDREPLQLEVIKSYPGLEGPYVHRIPDELLDEDGVTQTTIQGGTQLPGRLILWTSEHNMPARHKVLRPRWRLSYRSSREMLGSKSVSEIAPATPGAEFIYGQVELEALGAYATTGRVRPKDGPLVQAVDMFVSDKIRELAKQINDRRRHEQDSNELDDVHRENRVLDRFKNKFMPTEGFGGDGNRGKNSHGSGPQPPQPPPPIEYGTVPTVIEFGWATDRPLRIGSGVSIRLATILRIRVRDDMGRSVPGIELQWKIEDEQIARVEGGVLKGRHGGSTTIVLESLEQYLFAFINSGNLGCRSRFTHA